MSCKLLYLGYVSKYVNLQTLATPQVDPSMFESTDGLP